MPAFGQGSTKKLLTCHPKIKLICNTAIKYIDFTIVTGHRTEAEQNALYPKYTKLKWPHGKHNAFPSNAVDVAPYIKPYGAIFGGKEQIESIAELTGKSHDEVNAFVIKSYARLIGYMEYIAITNGIEIRVGIDWDGDFDLLDQSFHDLGHVELV